MVAGKAALIVGFGSIGERHARILTELGFVVSVVSRRKGIADKTYHFYPTIAAAIAAKKFDYAVVATETSAHADDLAALAHSGAVTKILVEKPLFAEPPASPPAALSNVHVGYQLRFHPAMQRLRGLIKGKRCLQADFYVGQHLDGWRAGRTGRETYSGSTAKGGGVLRDLSHELDLVHWLFGTCKRVTAIGGRLSNVTADSDDAWTILAELEHCPAVSVRMNYLDRIGQRQVVILADDVTITADLKTGAIHHNENAEQIACDRDTPIRDMHRAILEQDGRQACSYADGLKVVGMIDAIERAGHAGVWVSP